MVLHRELRMWTAIFYASAVGLCLLSLAGCIITVQGAASERASLVRRLRLCESTTQSQQQSIDDLSAIVNSVAQSQKMSRVRKATTHAVGSTGEPDPIREPEQWRTWMNAQLRTGQSKQ